MDKLQARISQVFVTTHSPFAIAAAADSSLWYMDHEGESARLNRRKPQRIGRPTPKTFLAAPAWSLKANTECGFVSALLEKALGSSLEQHGVHVSDGGGHESTLVLLEALAEARVCDSADSPDDEAESIRTAGRRSRRSWTNCFSVGFPAVSKKTSSVPCPMTSSKPANRPGGREDRHAPADACGSSR